MKQDRTLLLTDKTLYNVKKDAVKRRIDVADVIALSKSTKSKSQEFVVHVKAQYDYRFESGRRQEIFDAIKYVCWKQSKSNLPIFEVPESLKAHHTTKKNIAHGNDILPSLKYRKEANDYPPQKMGGGAS